MAIVYFSADGLGSGDQVHKVQPALMRWIRSQNDADLIVYGGDVYKDGKPDEFEEMLAALDGNVSRMCHTPGNHCWRTDGTAPNRSKIASGYEAFWLNHRPPASAQPIDTSKKAGGRYEHFIDLAGWRLIFLDTGKSCRDGIFSRDDPWPMGDPSRKQWLKSALAAPGRAKIVFAHHSRLSCGDHGDIDQVNELWETLFDSSGAPSAALTLSGHDHNVSVYKPRSRDVARGPVDLVRGIHVAVNGAGGRNHDEGLRGTSPDLFFNNDNYCLTRITLHDATRATVVFLDFGPSPDPPTAPAGNLFSLSLQV
jgi:3',5'-cyclic AMP phosphodiesterase CpdA